MRNYDTGFAVVWLTLNRDMSTLVQPESQLMFMVDERAKRDRKKEGAATGNVPQEG
jgi:hypothetical protein